jgi:hypothetical protein
MSIAVMSAGNFCKNHFRTLPQPGVLGSVAKMNTNTNTNTNLHATFGMQRPGSQSVGHHSKTRHAKAPSIA